MAYLNCAYTSPLPRIAQEAGQEAMARKAAPWDHPLLHVLHRPGGRQGGLRPGDGGQPRGRGRGCLRILRHGCGRQETCPWPRAGPSWCWTSSSPSNVYSWRRLSGGNVQSVARPAEGTWSAAVERAVTDAVGLVALPQCHWVDGTVFDLAGHPPGLRPGGGRTWWWTPTQSAGMMPLDLAPESGRIFWAVAAHKWLLCPYFRGLSVR